MPPLFLFLVLASCSAVLVHAAFAAGHAGGVQTSNRAAANWRRWRRLDALQPFLFLPDLLSLGTFSGQFAVFLGFEFGVNFIMLALKLSGLGGNAGLLGFLLLALFIGLPI